MLQKPKPACLIHSFLAPMQQKHWVWTPSCNAFKRCYEPLTALLEALQNWGEENRGLAFLVVKNWVCYIVSFARGWPYIFGGWAGAAVLAGYFGRAVVFLWGGALGGGGGLDFYLSRIFCWYWQSFDFGGGTERRAIILWSFEIFLIFPNFLSS